MTAHKSGVIELFTDGACRGNPGPGGWGAFLRYNGHAKSIKGAEGHTTNNRMELTAVIEGLATIKTVPSTIIVTTDSRYVQHGISEWIHKWKKNGWRTSNRAPVKNADLWRRLDELVQLHTIQWEWVKGHSGHVENELVDQLANEAIDVMLLRGEKK